MDIQERKQKTIESVGKEIVRIRSGSTYRLESFNQASGECVLIPTHVGGRKTRKSYLNLWLDYRLA
jgi:hypothetical protein